jgi:FAD/FMN-containing dehydrogenase
MTAPVHTDRLRRTLAEGLPVLAGWVAIGDSFSAEVMGSAGYDGLILDAQHGGISWDNMGRMLQALDLSDTGALVRLASTDQAGIMRALDLGAAGVIIPMVSTEAQARMAAAALRFPPEGVVIGQSQQQRQALWAVREDMQLGLAPMRPFRTYDVSMAVSDMPRFVSASRRNVSAAFPNAQMIFYGHAGDGNLHAVVTVRAAIDRETEQKLDASIFDVVRDVNGSISGEHGIGVSRAPFLSWTRSPRELQLMHALKQVLDPQHILNTAKVFLRDMAIENA